MDQRVLLAGIAVVALLIGAVFIATSSVKNTANQGMPQIPPVTQGAKTIMLFGEPVPLVETQGEDVPCIGIPPGYTRVYFDKTTDDVDLELSMTVGYYKEGDDLKNLDGWIRKKLQECGYTKTREEQLSVPGAHGMSLQYRKGDRTEVYIDEGVVTSGGQKYTLIRIGYDVYKEVEGDTGQEESTSSSNEESPEIQPVGDAKTWNDTIKPILSKVFPEIKLVDYSSIQGQTGAISSLEYDVGRSIGESDVEKITNAFKNSGWSKNVVQNVNNTITQIFSQGEEQVVVVSYEIGSTRIQVTPSMYTGPP